MASAPEKRRGRPKGSKNSLSTPLTSDLLSRMSMLSVGGSMWHELGARSLRSVQNQIATSTRYGEAMRDMRFTQTTHLAVSSPSATIYTLIRITRTA